MKNLIVLYFLLSLAVGISAQSIPYKNGSYNFGVFDKEYGRTTARCNVTINGNSVTAKVTKNMYGDIYRINQIIYDGIITKVGKFYFIIDDNSPPVSSEDFEFATPRIDFERGFIIHY
jgi:hypothetical protein